MENIKKRLQVGGLRERDVVWMFGSERTGSTWLSRMIAELPKTAWWDEPLIGLMLGNFMRDASSHQSGRPDEFVFGDNHKSSWRRSVSDFVVGEGKRRFSEVSRLLIKEPNGSLGAPLLMECMPESKMILLVRDPRDAVASALASHQKKGWLYNETNPEEREKWEADKDPDAFVTGRANWYGQNVLAAKDAFEAHRGGKAIVRYEDLHGNTSAALKRMYADLGIRVKDASILSAVQRHAWKNLPDEKKGEGQFNRKGQIGSYRDDLTSEQTAEVVRINEPLMLYFGYESEDYSNSRND